MGCKYKLQGPKILLFFVFWVFTLCFLCFVLVRIGFSLFLLVLCGFALVSLLEMLIRRQMVCSNRMATPCFLTNEREGKLTLSHNRMAMPCF